MRNNRPKKQNPATAGAADPLAPPVLPGITLTAEPLSRGPLGAVYKGWDKVHHYDVIVKVQQATGDPVAMDRFRREAAVMAQLRHPNIVALYQFHDGNPSALVMEYVPGQTLDALVSADGRLDPARATQIVEDIAAALDCIHAENVVHRDVKPSNILLAKNGPARLTDFGVAHIDTAEPLTVRGDMLGTIEYASPEQVKGTSVPDSRSDVYALAAVAYFALAGTPPFRAADSSMQSQLSVMHQQVFSEPPPLSLHRGDLSPAIDAAVRRGLAKDPDARYPSAGQFASALRSAVVAASGAPERVAMAVSTRRNTTVLTGALAGAALLVGGAVAVWNHEQPAPQFPLHPSLASQPAPAAVPGTPHTAPLPPKVSPAVKPGSKSKLVAVALPHPAPIARHITPPVRVAHALPTHAFLHEQNVLARLHQHKLHEENLVAHALRRHKLHEENLVAHALLARENRDHRLLAQANLTQKRAVTERPKFRRDPALVASAGHPAAPISARPLVAVKPAPVAVAAKPGPAANLAYLSVYAQQDNALLGRKFKTAAVPAQEVLVDGKPIPALITGGWAALPAGRHLVSYVPTSESGFGANPGLWVTLTPGAHLTRQILLPSLAGFRARPASALTASALPSPVKPNTALPAAPPPQKAAAAPLPQTVVAAVAPSAKADVGWYTVSGWIVRNASAVKPTLVRTSAQWVKVDGKPVLTLALGQWAELPAGKHTVTFEPTGGVGAGEKTWDIEIASQAHLDQHIPLPAAPAAAQEKAAAKDKSAVKDKMVVKDKIIVKEKAAPK